jgi:mannose-1-phosphate guanylyltransferase
MSDCGNTELAAPYTVASGLPQHLGWEFSMGLLNALIMAGGGGTRFWPRSRKARPKQFLSITGDRTLLQATYDRVEAQVPPERAWVITSAAHRDEVARQLPALPGSQIIGEPCGRDTAPCIGLGAMLIARRDSDAVMLVMPADHVIEPAQEFRRIAHAATQLAQENPRALVTFGILPTWPSTGYGYIQRGEELETRQGVAVHRVQKFREKPNEEQAREYIAGGDYYWNSGIFVGKADTFLQELKQHEPEMFAGLNRIADAWGSPRQAAVLGEEFPKLKKISIDFAVMEKAREVLVMRTPYRWDDVGSWLALERLHPQDAGGNTVLARHVGVETNCCVIVGDAGKLVATLGVNNLVIVQDGDCILIADRGKESDVKKIVEQLGKQGLEHFL